MKDQSAFPEGDPLLPDLITLETFLAEPIEPPSELVKGILHQGSKLVLVGEAKSFKTWCLLDLAISVATGTEWMGRATAQGKVLFLNFELQAHAWHRRIIAVAKAKSSELQPGQIGFWNLRGHASGFKVLMPRIIQRCREEHFALVVLDPICKLYGGTDENAAAAELLNALERLVTETGAAIAFGTPSAIGHAGGVFTHAPDSLLLFTKHETEAAFVVKPMLRNFAPVAPFAVRWEFPLMHRAGRSNAKPNP